MAIVVQVVAREQGEPVLPFAPATFLLQGAHGQPHQATQPFPLEVALDVLGSGDVQLHELPFGALEVQ